MQDNTAQGKTKTVQDNVIQHVARQDNTIQYNTTQDNTTQHNTSQ